MFALAEPVAPFFNGLLSPMRDFATRESLCVEPSAAYCAADLLPSGEPVIGVPGGKGRAAII